MIPKEQDEERDISSTYIREQLDLGNMEKANELLGFVSTVSLSGDRR